MTAVLHFFVQYEYFVLFSWVLLEQVGVPLPSAPLLVATGALSVEHSISLSAVLSLVVAACLLADSVWFFMGRLYGTKVLRFLCRFTLETSSCVSKTERAIRKQWAGTLLLAKFVPGLNLMAPPLAGQRFMRYSDFLLYDAAGSLLWGATLVLGGKFFGDAIRRNALLFHWMGHAASAVFILVVVAWILYRVWKKWSVLRRFRTTRVDPEYLKSKLDQGEPVYIIDLRTLHDLEVDARMLPGAVHIPLEKLMAAQTSIPDDREIFTYCTCPNEKTSVRAALMLQKMGRTRIHPVRGGVEAWKQRGYPLMEFQGAALPKDHDGVAGKSDGPPDARPSDNNAGMP
jgi:membrane protein DedA with SNARE-associated domain/rhodanese-related sulfurtransferase